VSAPVFTTFDDLHAEEEERASLRQLKEEVMAGHKGDAWKIVDGLITVGGKAYMATDSPCLSVILAAAHGMGHEGTEKMLHRLRCDFFVLGARASVKDHVQACVICQRNKVKHLHPAGLLQPLEVPSSVWAHLSMDFVEGFLRVNGKSVVLTVVDRFSKYAHFVPLGLPYTTTSVAKIFFDAVVCLHCLPESIVSDRDPVFTCKFWTELLSLSGVKLQLSTAFHPQSNG
jgi:transposase InsO family protein